MKDRIDRKKENVYSRLIRLKNKNKKVKKLNKQKQYKNKNVVKYNMALLLPSHLRTLSNLSGQVQRLVPHIFYYII